MDSQLPMSQEFHLVSYYKTVMSSHHAYNSLIKAQWAKPHSLSMQAIMTVHRLSSMPYTINRDVCLHYLLQAGEESLRQKAFLACVLLHLSVAFSLVRDEKE